MALGRSLGRPGSIIDSLGSDRVGLGGPWGAREEKIRFLAAPGVPRDRVPTQGGSRGGIESPNERFGAVVVFPDALESL